MFQFQWRNQYEFNTKYPGKFIKIEEYVNAADAAKAGNINREKKCRMTERKGPIIWL